MVLYYFIKFTRLLYRFSCCTCVSAGFCTKMILYKRWMSLWLKITGSHVSCLLQMSPVPSLHKTDIQIQHVVYILQFNNQKLTASMTVVSFYNVCLLSLHSFPEITSEYVTFFKICKPMSRVLFFCFIYQVMYIVLFCFPYLLHCISWISVLKCSGLLSSYFYY